MNMLNTVVVIGNFKHYTSKKGVLPLNFIIENRYKGDIEKIFVSVPDERVANLVLDRKNATGKIKVSGAVGNKCIIANNIDWE